LKRFIRAALSFLFLAALLSIPAVRIDWWEGRQFLVLFTISVSVMLYWVTKRDPELIAERMTVAENVERWDHVIVALYSVFLLALLIVAGFDSGRLNWSFVPITVKIGG